MSSCTAAARENCEETARLLEPFGVEVDVVEGDLSKEEDVRSIIKTVLEKGVALAQELGWIAEGRGSMASAALRWILDNEDITCVIPGFKNVQQVRQNLEAADVRPFTAEELERLRTFYREQVAEHIRGPY
jgi:aryl-alcohol dehydrogenase-like predicted oxidoreductase